MGREHREGENHIYIDGDKKPNHLWTSILIIIAILGFLLFVRSCKGK